MINYLIKLFIEDYNERRKEANKISSNPVLCGDSEQLNCRDCKYFKSEKEHDYMWCRDCQQMNRFKAI